MAQLIIQIIFIHEKFIKVAIGIDYFSHTMSYTLSSKVCPDPLYIEDYLHVLLDASYDRLQLTRLSLP